MSEAMHRRCYDVAIVAQSLPELHEYVTRLDARVEISRPGTDDRCVLISKREIEALERALEILSNTEDVRHVTEKIANLIAAAAANDFAAA